MAKRRLFFVTSTGKYGVRARGRSDLLLLGGTLLGTMGGGRACITTLPMGSLVHWEGKQRQGSLWVDLRWSEEESCKIEARVLQPLVYKI